MTTPTDLTNIATALLQVTGLLFPVVFLSLNFIKDEGYRDFSKKYQEKMASSVMFMIICLTGTGFFGTISLFTSRFRETLLLVGVSSLALFFLIYGNFIRLMINVAKDDF